MPPPPTPIKQGSGYTGFHSEAAANFFDLQLEGGDLANDVVMSNMSNGMYTRAE